jgi:chemotaxis protein CheD
MVDYQVKIFGGGNQFAHSRAALGIDVPERNVQAGLALLAEYGLHIQARHLGGHGPRQVILDLPTGDVWLRHTHSTREGLPQ